MVTSYYIMRMSKNNRKNDILDYYNTLFKIKTSFSEQTECNRCRICLQKGKIPIYSNEQMPELPEVVSSFGKIQLIEDDEYPKHLCEICFKFLKLAVLFRKTAKQSLDILKNPPEDANYDDYDQSQEFSDVKSDQETKINIGPKWYNMDAVKCKELERKKDKIKYAPKITCNICNKIIKLSYYKKHMTMHDPDHQKYVCEICGKMFRLRCAYNNHRLRHRSDFPYKCQFCPYRGRLAELLKNHMRTHTGDYRYMCTECPARFLFKSNLNSHIRKHKDPQFKCDTCKRAFHTNLMLQRHFEADHLGIKNHVCSMCGKAYGYRNAMMKHQRHVHKREKLLFGRMPSYLQDQHKGQENL